MGMTTARRFPFPSLEDPVVVVPAPGQGPGNWAGAASAVLVDGEFWLTYRVRRPLPDGRGVATVVARSADGVTFEPVCSVARDDFGAESFERPVVLRTPEGGWRLYLSCATPDSKHWWIEALDADAARGPPPGTRTVVLPGDETVAVKDPVITVREGQWEMWLCEHPLSDPGEEDRMSTSYLTSDDGLAWSRHGTVLAPTPGTWDARGARVTHRAVARPARRAVRRSPRPPRTTGTRPPRSRGPMATAVSTQTRRRRCSARPTPTAPSATPRRSPCPTARPASTSRWPAPTGPTTW